MRERYRIRQLYKSTWLVETLIFGCIWCNDSWINEYSRDVHSTEEDAQQEIYSRIRIDEHIKTRKQNLKPPYTFPIEEKQNEIS